MPLYDYHCERCGSFRLMRPMADSASSQPCPDCSNTSERVLSAPFLGGGGALTRPAGTAPGQTRVPWRAACGFGCTHAH